MKNDRIYEIQQLLANEPLAEEIRQELLLKMEQLQEQAAKSARNVRADYTHCPTCGFELLPDKTCEHCGVSYAEDQIKRVILSSGLMLEDGFYLRRTVDRATATAFAAEAENFCQHETTKLVGVEPAKEREAIDHYDVALVISPYERLEFGREYSVQELLEIGVDYTLIVHAEGYWWGYEGVTEPSWAYAVPDPASGHLIFDVGPGAKEASVIPEVDA